MSKPENVPCDEHECFSAASTAYLRSMSGADLRAECFAVMYQAPPRDLGNGRTSYSLNLPMLLVTGYLQKQKAIAEKVAAILNAHWDNWGCSCMEVFGEDPACELHGRNTEWARLNPDIVDVAESPAS